MRTKTGRDSEGGLPVAVCIYTAVFLHTHDGVRGSHLDAVPGWKAARTVDISRVLVSLLAEVGFN